MKTIKSKVTVGVIYLFAVILLLSVVGIIFINELADKSKGTITENYASVDYMMSMISAFSDIHSIQLNSLMGSGKDESGEYERLKKILNQNLALESTNVTEPGEKEEVEILQSKYKDYFLFYDLLMNKELFNKVNYDELKTRYLSVREHILNIYKLNMAAITNKTNSLQTTADDVTLYMLILSLLSIILTLTFVLRFPAKIVQPIKHLTEKIKSISERKYDQKLQIENDDELGELANAFNVMAERLKVYDAKRIDELLFEQKRLEALVHSFEDGILFIDEKRKVVLVNNMILQITGLKETDIKDRIISEVADHNDLVREIYNSVLAKKEAGDIDIKPIRVSFNNTEYFFNIESEEIITYAESEGKETFIGNLILLRNITQYQQRDKAKTNMLATASHELKTPLSSINLSLNLLGDRRLGELNSEQQELVKTLRLQSTRLSRVIHELLDFSQIETGNIRLKFVRIKPDIILDIGITALMMQISEKNIDLQTSIEEDLPEINVDTEKLAFVFINILNNAIRFSGKRDIIKIEVCKIDNNVSFSIIDNGPGISKENAELLFKRFSQVDAISKQGWGLGLAISKEFILAQGGRIWVESEIGKGSKFIFTIPVSVNN